MKVFLSSVFFTRIHFFNVFLCKFALKLTEQFAAAQQKKPRTKKKVTHACGFLNAADLLTPVREAIENCIKKDVESVVLTETSEKCFFKVE